MASSSSSVASGLSVGGRLPQHDVGAALAAADLGAVALPSAVGGPDAGGPAVGGGDHREPHGVHAAVGAAVDAGRGAGVGEGVPGHAPGAGAGFDVGDELVGDRGEQVVGLHGRVPSRCRGRGFALRASSGRRISGACQPTEGRLGPERSEGLDRARAAAQHGTPPQAGHGTRPQGGHGTPGPGGSGPLPARGPGVGPGLAPDSGRVVSGTGPGRGCGLAARSARADGLGSAPCRWSGR